jgi:hypothetical protein
MTATEAIVRLEKEIQDLRDKMSIRSKIATANDIIMERDPVDTARDLLELREVLKLKRLALSEAKSYLEYEQLEANQVKHDQQRDQICELTDELESEAKKLLTSVKKIARHYESICEIERQIKSLGQTATDWPKEAFQYTRPGDAVYRFLVNALAAEIDLNNLPISQWPSKHKAQQVADISEAFNGYLYWREEWLCRYDEPAIEEINHVS